MLKRISLRWRLTLLSSLLITVCCVGLTITLNISAFKMADTLEPAIPIQPAGSQEVPLSPPHSLRRHQGSQAHSPDGQRFLHPHCRICRGRFHLLCCRKSPFAGAGAECPGEKYQLPQSSGIPGGPSHKGRAGGADPVLQCHDGQAGRGLCHAAAALRRCRP